MVNPDPTSPRPTSTPTDPPIPDKTSSMSMPLSEPITQAQTSNTTPEVEPEVQVQAQNAQTETHHDAELITEIGPNDVVPVGKKVHPGNIQYHALIQKHEMEYAGKKRSQRAAVAKAIVHHIMNQNPPGRFLRKDKRSGHWIDIGYGKAFMKTRQELCNRAYMIKNNREGKANANAAKSQSQNNNKKKKKQQPRFEHQLILRNKEYVQDDDSDQENDQTCTAGTATKRKIGEVSPGNASANATVQGTGMVVDQAAGAEAEAEAEVRTESSLTSLSDYENRINNESGGTRARDRTRIRRSFIQSSPREGTNLNFNSNSNSNRVEEESQSILTNAAENDDNNNDNDKEKQIGVNRDGNDDDDEVANNVARQEAKLKLETAKLHLKMAKQDALTKWIAQANCELKSCNVDEEMKAIIRPSILEMMRMRAKLARNL